MKSKESLPIPPRVKAFCVGQAKSGTASIAGLLSASYRVAHEPERAATLDLILRHARGELSDTAVRERLRDRDARLDLEYDVAWANQFLIGHLLAVFPAARFLVLIRDCYTWLQSITDHLTLRDVPGDVREFMRWWFKPDQYPHSVGDRVLGDRGLFSVSAYLHAWNRHVDSCIGLIPTDRRLVLRSRGPRIHRRDGTLHLRGQHGALLPLDRRQAASTMHGSAALTAQVRERVDPEDELDVEVYCRLSNA